MKSLLLLILSTFWSFTSTSEQITTTDSIYTELIGIWEIDFSPENSSDNWGTIMTIRKATDNEIEAVFYNSNSREGRTAVRDSVIHFAFVTSDGNDDYNTYGRFENGVLYGSTHSLGRDFLAPWTAKKIK